MVDLCAPPYSIARTPLPAGLVLKNPVANPMLAFLVYRALLSSEKHISLPSSWQSCHALAPLDERMAEHSPMEWMQRLPKSFHDQVASSVASLIVMLSSESRRICSPSLIAQRLYGSAPSSSRVVFPCPPIADIQASAVPWRGDVAQASRQIIDAKESCTGSIWIEFDDESPAWIDALGLMAQQLGAGIWIHPPQRKEQVEKCTVMPGAMRWLATTPSWDQWCWPLSDALAEQVAIALAQCSNSAWIPRDLSGPRSRLSRWGRLPAWAWDVADQENSGLLGVSCMALALAIQASVLPLRASVI